VLRGVSGSEPAISPDGKRIAYVSTSQGAAQVFIAAINGMHAVDATQLAAQDASHPAWRSNGEVLFTAAGRPQAVYTQIGLSYSMDATIVSALVAIAIVLLLVRRWRMPFGAITVLFGSYAIALATQSDTYWDIPAAVAAGVIADIWLAVLKDRARTGSGFYAFAFAVPFAMTALYLASVRIHDGALAWPANMIFGAPFIAGFAGLLVSFCFAVPLPQAAAASEERDEVPELGTLVDRPAPSL
jgi:hypothetical protein